MNCLGSEKMGVREEHKLEINWEKVFFRLSCNVGHWTFRAKTLVGNYWSILICIGSFSFFVCDGVSQRVEGRNGA